MVKALLCDSAPLREAKRITAALVLAAALATVSASCGTGSGTRIGDALQIGVGIADLLSSTTLQLCQDGVIDDEKVCAAAMATQAVAQAVSEQERGYWAEYMDGLEKAAP